MKLRTWGRKAKPVKRKTSTLYWAMLGSTAGTFMMIIAAIAVMH